MVEDAPVQNTGTEFADADVARAYLNRTPYPDALYDRLAETAPRRGRVLDLGCGPGKLTRGLADRFDAVVAIDPSEPMIALGQALGGGARGDIVWVAAKAEDADFGGPLDLAVAGSSIHWMRFGTVFPKLARALASDARLALIEGDGPAAAPWREAYHAVIVDWIGKLGHVYNSPQLQARAGAQADWIDVTGRESFEATVRMTIEDLIDGEHSRATWTRAKMGPLAEAFDADLRAVLEPHAENGVVEFTTRTDLVWCRPRQQPREAVA
ncbi:trans-aconitate 2-methyltransferase [Phenylobacterium sp.]|uniref:class I SAM-dependent methyltransferase n=1 Tax=Phenylobacterium sp. TaxID=1871053 RepID=UPI0035AE6405